MPQRILTLNWCVRRIQHHENSSDPANREKQFNVPLTISRENPDPVLRLNTHGNQTTSNLLTALVQLAKCIPYIRPGYHNGISIWEFPGLLLQQLTH